MEAEMKKRIFLGFAMLMLTLFLVSCVDIKYEAYVTVVNIGNIPMTAWVDGDGADIAAYDSVTWAIPLDSENEVRSVLLEAEPSGGGDSDEITGWDQLQGGKPLKKESSVLHGPAPASK
jgi:hypothetical protein